MVKKLTQVEKTQGAMGAKYVQSEALDLPSSPRSVQPCGPTFSWGGRFAICEAVHHPQQTMSETTKAVILAHAGGSVAEQASREWGQEVGCLRREILVMIQG